MASRRTLIRTVILAALIVAGLFYYISCLMQMQIVEGQEYARAVEQGSVRIQTVKAARGEILDRYGRPMAINRIGFNVVFNRAYLPYGDENKVILDLIHIMEKANEPWIDNLPLTASTPFQFRSGYDEQVARLRKTLELAPYATVDDVLYAIIKKYKLENYAEADMRKIAAVRYEMTLRGFGMSTPYTFATDITNPTATQIKELGFELPGVDIEESPRREYVAGDLAPHIIGQIGPIYAEQYAKLKDKGYSMNDLVGQEGIEAAMEAYLRGTDGKREIILNSSGDVVDVVDLQDPVPGNTIMLTIDRNLQRVAQDSLEKTIANLQATAASGRGKEACAGAAVAIEIATGNILCSATYPSYDINDYRPKYGELINDPLRPLFNRATQGVYAAGSTYKPSVATAGLNEGIIDRDSTVYCGMIYTFYDDYQPRCLRADGNINVLNALRVSCNIFFYDVGRRLGIDTINKYSKAYGLGEPTGIEIYEETGQRSSPQSKRELWNEDWYPGDVLQSSIGQLVNGFTPLQLANYAATIARRGVRLEAHVVGSIKSYTFEETIKESGPVQVDTVPGTDEVFQTVIDGMKLAGGPTGTSLGIFNSYPFPVAAKTGTPETTEFPNSTYICFAPADTPQIAVAVVIEKGWHGYTGAPVAKDIFDAYFFGEKEEFAPIPQGTLLP